MLIFLSYRPDRFEEGGVSAYFLVVSAGSLRRRGSEKERVVRANPAVSAGSRMRCLECIMRQRARRLGRIAQKISTCGREHGVSPGSMSMSEKWGGSMLSYRPDRCAGGSRRRRGSCVPTQPYRPDRSALLSNHHAAESAASRPDRSDSFYMRLRRHHFGRIGQAHHHVVGFNAVVSAGSLR